MKQSKRRTDLVIIRAVGAILLDFVGSILFLGVGVALMINSYNFVTTASRGLVWVFIVVVCVLLSWLMAWIFDRP